MELKDNPFFFFPAVSVLFCLKIFYGEWFCNRTKVGWNKSYCGL